MIDFELVSRLPNVEQANRRVESIEDCEWHRDVRDYNPSPLSEELQMRWAEACVSFDQCVYKPHRDISHKQESHNLPTGPET